MRETNLWFSPTQSLKANKMDPEESIGSELLSDSNGNHVLQSNCISSLLHYVCLVISGCCCQNYIRIPCDVKYVLISKFDTENQTLLEWNIWKNLIRGYMSHDSSTHYPPQKTGLGTSFPSPVEHITPISKADCRFLYTISYLVSLQFPVFPCNFPACTWLRELMWNHKFANFPKHCINL